MALDAFYQFDEWDTNKELAINISKCYGLRELLDVSVCWIYSEREYLGKIFISCHCCCTLYLLVKSFWYCSLWRAQNVLQAPPIEPLDNQLSLDDLDVIKVIGKGSSGNVQLVRHKFTGQFFALKVFPRHSFFDAAYLWFFPLYLSLFFIWWSLYCINFVSLPNCCKGSLSPLVCHCVCRLSN